MSRQYDEYMEGKIDINGELYSLIEPTNLDELMKAYEVRDAIETYYSGLMHDDDSRDAWLSTLQEQEEYIEEYLKNLGEFDNTLLVRNITYLAKKYGFKFGDLESAIGLSAGYISRTAKTDSKKKMSIDVVWKLSKLFEVDIRDLIETDLSIPRGNGEALVKFVEKLKRQTIAGELDWQIQGGYTSSLDSRYEEMGLIKEQEDESSVYLSNNLNQQITWTLTHDIYALKNFYGEKDLVIVSFADKNSDKQRIFDYLLTWKDKEGWKWERVFCTADDAFCGLSNRSEELVNLIDESQFEPKISIEHRNMIDEYLKEDD